ncbi:MAG: GerMN domain-containing protein [Acidaminococcaceae bacterium]|nr:GerMN domain-containing protein [Acidaminococcaceae bacterium]MDD4721379.1 GerMN domain-containing protein [Acidaminococcaceae bacterium]
MNSIKKLTTALVIFCCLALVSGCAQNSAPNITKPGSTATDKNKKTQKMVDKKVVLYRVPTDGSPYLLAESKIIKVTNNDFALATVKALVETLPADRKMQNVFPKGTKVLGVSVQDGIATVNFSKEFTKKTEGEYASLMMVNAVVNTLTQYPEIKKVRILAAGQKIVVLGQMDLEEPLARNESFIKKVK